MTRPVRVGQIPYLNCLPFFHAMEGEAGVRLSPLVPSALLHAATGGTIDAGPVPLVDTWEIEDHYVPLDDFCISVVDQARSVLLFSKVPFERLDGATVGVTHESSTSVRLLKVMLSHVWRVRPARFVALDPRQNDAYLLIGDEALLHRRGDELHPNSADLGEVWHKWTGLPFVFARWVVRRDLPASDRDRLCALLEHSMATSRSQLDRICAARAAALGMTIGEVREYLEGFRFRATAAEHEAMSRFRDLDAPERASRLAARVQADVKG
jgi:chorismate dehydratase